MYESNDRMVSHPAHYQSKSGLEVIDVIEAFTDGLNGVEATDTGNIIKYACRWKHKNGIQDIEKIIWYATHLKDYLENQKNSDELIGDVLTADEISTLVNAAIGEAYERAGK